MITLTQFRRLNTEALASTATFIAAGITASPTTFGLNTGQATVLSDAAEVLATYITDLQAALAVVDSLRIGQEAAKQTVIDEFSSLLNLSYADPAVSDVSLGGLGLAPRNNGRSTVVPVQPTDLIATPRVDGTVKLVWDGTGNKYGVMFEVQAGSIDATEWVTVASTTRRNIIVSGFTPGQIRWFKVRASKNGVFSEWSLVEGIYLPTNGETLMLAQAA